MCGGREGGGDGRVKSNGCLTEKGEKETQELSLFCETVKTKQADYPPHAFRIYRT